MPQAIKLLIAQTNPQIGAIKANAEAIIDIIKAHQDSHDLIAFPELSLTGYTLEDLVFRKELHEETQHYLDLIRKEVADCHVIIGHPTPVSADQSLNSISIIHQQEIIRVYHKQKLPNYEVFDEYRYYIPGPQDPCVLTIKGKRIGLCICEDLWQSGPVEDLLAQNIDIFLSMNASPFDHGKYYRRENILRGYAQKGVQVVYVNQVNAQDELLFDGQSIAMDKNGTICARAKAFESELLTVTLEDDKVHGTVAPLLSKEALIYKGLVFGTREYVHKNHFKSVLLGLSGGIDSALTLCIATDALGAENVTAVLLPSRYSSAMSLEDAMAQVKALGVHHEELSIEPAFETLMQTLKPHFPDHNLGTTEENLQARVRGILLMALSNKMGSMVLTTSNKSEAAVGYATLYGDMAGGLAVIKDVLKTEVYDLARYRNSIAPVIPERVITRAPSAELRPNQTDQDSLPDYPTLDKILVEFMQNGASAKDLIAMGIDAVAVHLVLRLLSQNEYKRRQSAPGIKISPIAFGKDWRFPISSGFKCYKV